MKKQAQLDTFAVRLGILLVRADMTTYRLAQLAGLPKQTVGRYLKGEREPTYANAVRIARALEVSVEAFADTVPLLEKPS